MQEKDFSDDTTVNDGAAPGTVPAQQLVDPFALYLRNEGGRGAFFEGDYLNFNGQTGVWTRKKQPIGATVPFLCNMHEIAIGWIKFEDGKARHEIGRIIDGYQRVPREALDDPDERDWPLVNSEPRDPWKMVTYLPMRCEEDGEAVVYGPFSFTARKAIADFVAAYHRSDRAGKFPLVLLENRNFTNRSGGLTYVPSFKIVGWNYWETGIPVPEAQPVAALPPPAAAAKPAPVTPKTITARDDMEDEIPF